MSKAAPKHTKEDLEFLFKLYLQKRIASQSKFYESRVRENELNSNFTFTAATLVMTLSSLFATIGATDPGGSTRILVVLSAVLPAFAALLAGFRQLYGWDRQVSIYRSAKLGLERAALFVPDNDLIAESDVAEVYPRLIASTELVLTNEVNQWGQFLLDKDKQNEQTVDRVEVIDHETQREQVYAYSQTAEMQAIRAASVNANVVNEAEASVESAATNPAAAAGDVEVVVPPTDSISVAEVPPVPSTTNGNGTNVVVPTPVDDGVAG